MRILMLSQFYPPTIGGEEQHVRRLSHALARRGHDVAVATLWHEGLADFELDREVRIYRIPGTIQRAGWIFSEDARRHAPPFPDPETIWALRNIIVQEQPEVVHAHNWLVHSFLPLKSWSKAKLVVTLHDYSLLCAKKRLMYRNQSCSGADFSKCLTCSAKHYGKIKGTTTMFGNWMMSRVEQKLVDMFLPVSQAVAQGNQLAEKRVPYQVVPNFLPDIHDVEQQNADEYLAQLPDGKFLLYVGDLSKDKGIHILLRAYAGLPDAPPLVLIGRICGDTPTEIPPNVLVLNSWPHYAVTQAWERSLAVIVPSVWPEPFGMVVIEAMAAGRPVIASRSGGLTDIVVESETGLLVPPGDVEALRAAIQALLDDPALCLAMGQAGRQRVKIYQANVVTPAIEYIYAQLLQLNTCAPGKQSRPYQELRSTAELGFRQRLSSAISPYLRKPFV
ncbi:MAG: glycosyltransferase family 4 protein [Caldilineaceae bacterium]